MNLSVWVSDDLAHWESRPLPESLPLYDYAPDVRDLLCFLRIALLRRRAQPPKVPDAPGLEEGSVRVKGSAYGAEHARDSLGHEQRHGGVIEPEGVDARVAHPVGGEPHLYRALVIRLAHIGDRPERPRSVESVAVPRNI